MNLRTKVWIFILLITVFFSCETAPTEKRTESRTQSGTERKKQSISVSKDTEVAVEYDYNTDDWEEISFADDSILLDLRYAQTNNFVKKKLYNCPRCFLRPDIAGKLNSVNNDLMKKGYKLKVYDCYRPKPVQEELWKIMPDEDYVAAPWKGSMHNRGIAVDLTIADKNNKELDMGTPFDFFGEEAHFTYTDFPPQVLVNRQLLKSTMEKYGFQSIRTEWWHYSVSTRSYPISEWQWQCN
ncbi:MAG: M15 family metallopeptidase [Saprospiraceae bacterium]|nr:M15 family metallopeptidase [Saprospiraceae bacterium]